MHGNPSPVVSIWTISTSAPVGDVARQAELVERVRPLLEAALRRSPQTRELKLPAGNREVMLRHVSGDYVPGAPLRLICETPASQQGDSPNAASHQTPLAIQLPSPHLTDLEARLVGVESIQDEIQLQLGCRWSGLLESWSRQTGCAVPLALQEHFRQTLPLFIFSGDPGTGKTSLAETAANRFCRESQSRGVLLRLTTKVRGRGLVGEYSSNIHEYFAPLQRVAKEHPCFLSIDEAESIAVRRSEAQSHQEDRAATATLLQCLDAIPRELKIAVFLTTNLPESLDPALLRRGQLFRFPRPDVQARRKLLLRWSPDTGAGFLDAAAQAADGMTPHDIERALARVYLGAIASRKAADPGAVLRALREGERTAAV